MESTASRKALRCPGNSSLKINKRARMSSRSFSTRANSSVRLMIALCTYFSPSLVRAKSRLGPPGCMVRSCKRWRREGLRMVRIGMSALCGLRLIHDATCQGKQARTDFQVRLVGSLQIYVKLNCSPLAGETHDPTGVKKLWCFSDGEHHPAAHGIQRLVISLLLRVAYEQNLEA